MINQIIDFPLLLTKCTSTTAVPGNQILPLDATKMGKYSNESVTVFLAEEFIVCLSVEMFLDSSGLRFMQSNDVVFLPHFITVYGAESRSKTAHGRDVENSSILNTIVGLASERRANHSVNDTRAAVGCFVKIAVKGMYSRDK